MPKLLIAAAIIVVLWGFFIVTFAVCAAIGALKDYVPVPTPETDLERSLRDKGSHYSDYEYGEIDEIQRIHPHLPTDIIEQIEDGGEAWLEHPEILEMRDWIRVALVDDFLNDSSLMTALHAVGPGLATVRSYVR